MALPDEAGEAWARPPLLAPVRQAATGAIGPTLGAIERHGHRTLMGGIQ